MTAIATDTRNVARRRPGERHFPIAAGVKIFAGAQVALDNTGYLRPARATATDKVVGTARTFYDNTAGIAGADGVDVESDLVAAMFNSTAGDAIALTDIGADCYAVDDQTVALTDGGGTRPRAGKIHNVTSDGVWVRYDQ